MENVKTTIQDKKGPHLLFESSLRAVPFNIVVATLLAIYLATSKDPKGLLVSWLAAMYIVNIIRLVYFKVVIKNNLLDKSVNLHLKIFLVSSLVVGLIWSSIYFISIPYSQESQLDVIMLFFAGMAAGSPTSLSVFFPALVAYIFGIFLPVIIYHYSFMEFRQAILATAYLFFLLAICIIAKASQRLLQKIFFLTEQNELLVEKFELLSITDPLTGLYNRRHFSKCMHDEFNRAKRNLHSFTLISIDIDHFKLINDNFGHSFGDNFIIYAGNYLKYYLKRANEIIFRLGGDEFAAILINTSEEKTKEICETIITQFIKNPAFDYEPRDEEHQKLLSRITMSIGVVNVPYTSTATVDQIIEKADESLYLSKNKGKNQINYTVC